MNPEAWICNFSTPIAIFRDLDLISGRLIRHAQYVILAEEEAIKNRNLEELMACYHDKARVSLPSIDRNPPVVSKREWENYLEDGGWGEYGTDIFLNPKITIKGDKATFKCSSQAPNVIVRHTYDLIKEDEKWYIINYDYTW